MENNGRMTMRILSKLNTGKHGNRPSRDRSGHVKSLDELALKPNQRNALEEARQRLAAEFGVRDLVLFGSAARGQDDAESDLDLLVLVPRPFTRRWRHGITDAVFEVNLKYGTNLSTLVVERKVWEKGPYSVLPIHAEIAREGIPL